MSNGTTKDTQIGTPKQRKAAKLLAENVKNGAKEPIKKSLAAAGYKPAIVNHHSTDVVQSKTFQDLLDKHLPEKALTKKHKQLLNAANVIDSYVFSNSLTDQEIKKIIESIPGCKFIRTQRNTQNAHAYFYKPDNGTQYKSLELAYKIRKKLGNDTPDGEGGYTEEIKAVIVHIRKILPPAGQ